MWYVLIFEDPKYLLPNLAMIFPTLFTLWTFAEETALTLSSQMKSSSINTVCRMLYVLVIVTTTTDFEKIMKHILHFQKSNK